DDLSGVAGVLDGLRRIRESDLPHKGVEVLFTVAEEIGLLGSKHFDYSRIRSKEGYLFDGDGRLGTIVKSAPSQAVLEIEVFGKAAHAGCEPEKGINAIIGLSRILASIRDGRLDTESTANFSYIQGGKSSTNIVCDYAYCKGETRSKHHENMLDYIAYFHRHAKEAVGDLNVVVNTKDTLVCEAFDFDRDTAVVKNAIRVCGDMGIPCEVVDSGGCMDANIFNVHGMETVGMGTGMEEVHTFSEYQWLEDLHRIGEMIERITR
ncbi:MAG TPA: peptidase, partial [Clostridiales bacterium]|nr:peptidase [Clostridiales bacterium]